MGGTPLGALAPHKKASTLVNCILVQAAITQALRLVDRTQVPDLPDRIIAATALHLGVPSISRDRRIQLSSVNTIW